MSQEQSIQNKKALSLYKQALSRYIRSAMTLRGLQYADLSERLGETGIIYSADNLRNKVSRGMFSADLLLALSDVLGIEEDITPAIIKLKREMESKS